MKLQMNPGNGAGQPSSSDTPPTSPTFRRKRWLRTISLTLLTAWLGQAQADTYVPGGNISGTWTKTGSRYIVTGNCTVPLGYTLTIEPGVEVIINQGWRIDVHGGILAVGSPSERITIRGDTSSSYWDTIFTDSAPGDSRFAYCNISEATNAISLKTPNEVYIPTETEVANCVFSNCVVSCIYGHANGYGGWRGILNPLIKNCRFINSNGGIHLSAFYGKLNPRIANNFFQTPSGTAVLVEPEEGAEASYPQIVNNLFKQCATALQTSNPFDCTVENNIFIGCTTGVSRTGDKSGVVANNCFTNNTTNFVGYDSGGYGVICPGCVNRNGTPRDSLYNIFVNPLFCETTNYTLSASSPCIDAGDSGSAYLDNCFASACQQGSLGTSVNDLGIYGGPYACGWINPPGTNFTLAAKLFMGVTINPSTPGNYRLEYRPNVSSGIWTQLTNVSLLSTPWTYIDFDYPAVGKRFYRGVLLQ